MHSRFFTLIFLPSNDLKFAFVVSKKVGNAVNRNRVKRRLRAIARELHFSKGWYLFLAKPTIKDANFQDIKKEVSRCLLQLEQ